MLGTCSEAAYQGRRETNSKMKDMQNETEGRKATELLLSLRTEQLQKQLQEAHLKTQKLGEHAEVMLM